MRLSSILFWGALFLAGASPSWSDSFLLNGQCHDVDMYGIYKVCGAPSERDHERHSHAIVQPVYITLPQPLSAPAPVSVPVPTDNDLPHRELTAVEAKLHALHLLLVDKQTHSEVGAAFFDEETRYLAEIEHNEQSAADRNGGYLTVAQEDLLLHQLQDVENEINENISTNG
jgi:hypothetical protein